MDINGYINLRELFDLCDLNKSGYIEKDELMLIQPHLSSLEIDRLLEELDTDGDGRISYSELVTGLDKIATMNGTKDHVISPDGYSFLIEDQLSGFQEQANSVTRSMSCGDLTKKVVLERSISQISAADDEISSNDLMRKNSTIDLFRSLDSHNEAFQVYCHLAQDDVNMLKKFEVFMEEAVQRIKDKTSEKEALERAFNEEQKKQQVRLEELEEEADHLSRKAEQKTIEQLQSKFELDKTAFENEIKSLRDDLENMKQLEFEVKQEAKSQLIPMKNKLVEMDKLLQKLESEKMEAETTALLAKSQLTAYKHSVDMQSVERERDKEIVLTYMTEQANLAQQVKELQEVNKHLQETNTDLQGEMITLKRKISRRENRNYSNSEINDSSLTSTESESSRIKPDSPLMCYASETLNYEKEVKEVPLSEELDQAVSSSFPDDKNTESPTHKIQKVHTNNRQHLYDVNAVETLLTNHNHTKTSQPLPRSSSQLPDSYNSVVCTNPSNEEKEMSLSHAKQGVPQVVAPNRIFKVVFGGDAGVGKSSFILHLCKGKFQSNITSTLGIDFYTKIIELEQNIVSLQLWDTAGQERFRSISTSYFRKADGVVLLYDVCSERSFVSIREWVNNIRETSDSSDLPIVICGNKIDVRQEKEMAGSKVVTTDMGEKLALECKAAFCEVSAKTGEQLDITIENLSRAMKQKEDETIKRYETGLHLHNKTVKQKSLCCT